MSRVLVVEPAAPLREFLRLHLETAGHDVLLAEDTATGAQCARERLPDLIFTGTGKGGLDGLALLATLRGAPDTAAIPIVFVSARADREAVARSLEAGARLYLVLPVMREELLRAVSALALQHAEVPANVVPLRRAGSMTSTGFGLTTVPRFGAVAPNRSGLEGANPAVITGDSRAGAAPEPDRGTTALASQEAHTGTVLFADIRSFSTLAETLSTQEVADLLSAYFVRACEPILQQRGWIVKLLGDGVLAMFEPQERAVSHAERALKAALLMCVVAQRFNGWLAARFPDRRLPEFAIGVGVHTGDVMVCRINTGAGLDTTIIGDTVNVASRLEEQTKKLGAGVVTTLDTLSAAGTRFIPGKRGSLLVRGRSSPVEITEIVGLRPRPDADARALPTYELIKEAVSRNTLTIVRVRDEVLSEPHRIRSTGQFAPLRPADTPVKIPGFRLLRKLGQGGMSRALLAEQEATGTLRVLKVLNLTYSGYDLLRRFVQEHQLVSEIRHPNVATIFGHGQTETHAYIVMEYFPRGDLRQCLARPMPVAQALHTLRQIAHALTAIHQRGIVHRDLKPDNLMLREDGTLVLADFGIAKDLQATLSHTRRGEGLGTPYYLSPEQALGKPVDQRSDLYSLGVMFYEMLTGERPFNAEDAPSLLAKHVNAPVPRLPAQLARLQLVIDRLLAKSPDERFSSAADLINVLAAFGT
jgi:class 3 adenylate cyclase/CheY-like chemotaxis protein